jgi:hypothetical protein
MEKVLLHELLQSEVQCAQLRAFLEAWPDPCQHAQLSTQVEYVAGLVSSLAPPLANHPQLSQARVLALAAASILSNDLSPLEETTEPLEWDFADMDDQDLSLEDILKWRKTKTQVAHILALRPDVDKPALTTSERIMALIRASAGPRVQM